MLELGEFRLARKYCPILGGLRLRFRLHALFDAKKIVQEVVFLCLQDEFGQFE